MNDASPGWIFPVLAVWVASAGAAALRGEDETVERFEAPAGGALPAGWAAEEGKWRVENGVLLAEADGGEARLRVGERSWQDLALEVAVHLERWEAGAGVAVDFARAAGGEPAFHSVVVRGVAGGDLELAHAVTSASGAARERVRARASAPAAGAALRLRVEVGGGRARAHIDGKLSLESALALDAREGTVALRAFRTRATFDDLQLAALEEEERVRIRVDADRRRSMVVVAHRGASSIAPENTLASLRLGAAMGADACEFDVHRTQDGEIVLIHDKDVLRTTDFQKVFPDRPPPAARVEALSRDELARLDAGSWKSPAYRGEKLPTLRQALALLRGRAVAVVEIKGEDIGRDVARVVREEDATDGVYVFSFSARAIEDVRAELPSVPTGLLFEGGGPPDGARLALEHVRRARRAGASAVACHYSSITPEYLAEAHRRAMAVWVYTVDEPAVMVMLRDMGLDGLITNVPDVAVRVRVQASPGDVFAAGASPAAGGAEFEARPGRKGLKVRLEPGEFTALEIARLASDARGLPLLVDGADRAALGEKILVPGAIAEADEEIAKALLEAGGFRLHERELAGGGRVLILESAAADARPQEPKDQPIVVVEGRGGGAARGAAAPAAGRSVASGPEKEAARVAGLVLGPVPEAVRAQTRLGRGEGVLVEEIDEKSRGRPDMAPLRRFDVVTRVADRPVGSAGDFVKALNELEPGEKFFYRLLRGGVTLIVPARK